MSEVANQPPKLNLSKNRVFRQPERRVLPPLSNVGWAVKKKTNIRPRLFLLVMLALVFGAAGYFTYSKVILNYWKYAMLIGFCTGIREEKHVEN